MRRGRVVILAAVAILLAGLAAWLRLRKVEHLPLGAVLRCDDASFVADRAEAEPSAGGARWTIELRVVNESQSSPIHWDPSYALLLDASGTPLERDAGAQAGIVEIAPGGEERFRLVYRAPAAGTEPQLRITLEQQPLLNLFNDLRWGRRVIDCSAP
jgi:hypothetical protein